MGRRKPPKPPLIVASGPDSLRTWAVRYLDWARVRNYSEATVESRSYQLHCFMTWAETRDVTRPVEVTRPILERYMRHLYQRRKENGRALSLSAQLGAIMPVRSFFKWLAKENAILANPASDLELPRTEHRLPKHVLTVEEAEKVLGLPDVTRPVGLRDRAMLEVLYSTGMRRGELVSLGLYDLDAERGTAMIRQGKGKKDRMVPVGERAMAWVERYLVDARPQLVVPPDPQALFLTPQGEAFVRGSVTNLVKRYVAAADLGKTGACHLFRHTAATLMLEGGADIRYIQQLLGHAKLTTTEIYTQVSIRKLKQVHAETHPGARLTPRAGAAGELAETAAADALADGSSPAQP